MKPKNRLFRQSIAALTLTATFSLASQALAANGNWNVDADGNWNTGTNWSSTPAVPGTTAGDVVGLNFDITADRIVTIDTPVRLGTLNVGDPDGSNAYTLALSSGSLTFDNGTNAAQLNQPAASGASTISAPATLQSHVAINNASAATLTLSGVLTNGSGGARSVTLNSAGTGVTILSGANTFSGGLVVQRGTVVGTTSNQAFGSAGISLGDSAGSADAAVRALGNINFPNAVVVTSGSSGNTLTIFGSGGGGPAVGETATFSGGITLQRNLVADSLDGTLILTNLVGTSNVTVANTSATPTNRLHRVTLNNSNPAFTGSVTISSGATLRIANSTTALGFDNIVEVRPGGLFELNAGPVTIAGLNDQAGSGGTVSVVGQSRNLAVGGSGSYSFNGTLTDYQPAATVLALSLTKSGAGTQALGGTNTYTGLTIVNGGVLLLNSAEALPGGIGATGGLSGVRFGTGAGGVIGLTAASGDFLRGIEGGTPTAEKVGWAIPSQNGPISQGGFAAFGGDRLVNFGGAADPITWNPGQGILGGNLILGHTTADSKVTVVNPIDLGGFARTVTVNDGTAAVDGEFSGIISGGGQLNKAGTGTLDLTAANTYGAATNVLAGTLRIRGLQTGTNNGVTISDGASLILAPSGQLSFAPTTNGTTNKITGTGSATLEGTLFFKLGGADLTDGNAWTIVDATSVTSNLAAVASFPALTWVESPAGVWKAASGANTWTYTESSGVLSLAVGAAGYESWATANGINGASFTADNDDDGIDNGTEYAIGGNPTAFTAPAALTPAGANFTLTYPKGTEAAADPKIDYVFEVSPDLGITTAWTEVEPTAETTTSVSYTLEKSGPRRFVRLKIKKSE